MWYYISDGSSSNDPFEIDCQGSSSTSASFIKYVYKDGDEKATTSYNFETNPASVMSGIYQCSFESNPVKFFWEQKTTNVLIASMCFFNVKTLCQPFVRIHFESFNNVYG